MKSLFTCKLILRNLLLVTTFTLSHGVSHSQILESEIKPDGIVFPRMDTNARNLLTAIQGQCIYNLDVNSIECYDGTSWVTQVVNTGNSNKIIYGRESSLLRNAATSGGYDVESIAIDTFLYSHPSHDSNRGLVGRSYFSHGGRFWASQEGGSGY